MTILLEVHVNHVAGRFVSRETIVEALTEAIESADLEALGPNLDAAYEVEWTAEVPEPRS